MTAVPRDLVPYQVFTGYALGDPVDTLVRQKLSCGLVQHTSERVTRLKSRQELLVPGKRRQASKTRDSIVGFVGQEPRQRMELTRFRAHGVVVQR